MHGYHIWANAVCRNLKCGNKSLDEQIDEIFKTAGVSSYDPEV